MIEISVILVVRNEKDFVIDCIRSIEQQFSANDEWELIVVDGMSTDNTKTLASEYLDTVGYKWQILDNRKKTLAPGWNIGIKHSLGRYVLRPDAHSRLHEGYISNGLKTLRENPEVTVVGGLLETKSKGFMGNIIRVALSSRVGVGNSSFRTATKSGFSDTSVYGIYRREVFEHAGYFNEGLVRHQDNEMHKRIKEKGGRFYLNVNMKADYYCRSTIPALLKQMFNIGRYLPDVLFSGSLNLRHLAPFAFFTVIIIGAMAGLSISPPLFWASILGLLIYLFVIAAESAIKSIRGKDPSLLLLIFVIPLMHMTYAAGTFWGLLRLIFNVMYCKQDDHH